MTVNVLYRLHYAKYAEILRELGEDRDTPDVLRERYLRSLPRRRNWRELRDYALENLVEDAPDLEEVQQTLRQAHSKAEFIEAIRSANRIEIDDDGEGMSMDILQRVYLTIGTSYRAEQKRAQYAAQEDEDIEGGDDDRPILGEKGLGRLSAMRLGDRVLVVTAQQGSPHWNQLGSTGTTLQMPLMRIWTASKSSRNKATTRVVEKVAR